MHDSNLNRLYDYVIRRVIWYILYGDVTIGNALKFNYIKNRHTLSHNVELSKPRLSGIRTHNVSGDKH
jgi:hypothetical protein